MILLKTLLMAGPKITRMTITTMETKTRINAYSTRPWPFSFGANNMVIPPFFRYIGHYVPRLKTNNAPLHGLIIAKKMSKSIT